METALVWFRDDLRVSDNPALQDAVATGKPVNAIFVLDEISPGIRPLGSATKWWLHHSICSLQSDLKNLGVNLIIEIGSALNVLPKIAKETGATSVHWNRRYGPAREIDAELKRKLPGAKSHSANLLHEPWRHLTGSGTQFKVFTPFWKAFLAGPAPRLTVGSPTEILGDSRTKTYSVDSLNLLPSLPWASRFNEVWSPGEKAAQERLRDFIEHGISKYDQRDFPGISATSMLSPHLRFGEISPNQIWWGVQNDGTSANSAKFLSELGWREFSYHQLFHNPNLASENLRKGFDDFPWQPLNLEMLSAWKKGKTGFSLVDAGMKELWAHGTMHNRVRMVAASFLVKNLGQDWRIGEQWFWDTLVDADEASNPASWQWVAGSGADAAPYFRIFNPELQADRFDPEWAYRKQWLDESDPVTPIVDLTASRARALADYAIMKGEHQSE